MKSRLKKIHIHFKREYNFNTINILFPHYWLQDPPYDHERYRSIMLKNTKIRVEILKTIVKFVQETEKFKYKEWGI